MSKLKRYIFTADIEFTAKSPEDAVEEIHNQIKKVGDWARVTGMIRKEYGSFDYENINYNKILGGLNESKRKK